MQLSREQGIGGQSFLEFLWKSLEMMIWREENVDLMGVDELLGGLPLIGSHGWDFWLRDMAHWRPRWNRLNLPKIK